jgi:hypothetical protein
MIKKLAVGVGALLSLGLVGLVVLGVVANRPVPQAAPSAEADVLARAMMAAVHAEKWDETGAVEWTFADRNHHLWDRQRGYVRVEGGTGRVLVRLHDRTGVAFKDGQPVPAAELQNVLNRAYAAWVNDSFWMMGPAHLFDEGTTRALVKDDDGTDGVLVRYASGGVTPGDSYLWLAGPDHVPNAWRMWVKIIPVGGLRVTWEGWTPLDTGVQVATAHHAAGVNQPTVTGVRGARTLQQLVPGADPFAQLEGAAPAAQPASMPAAP